MSDAAPPPEEPKMEIHHKHKPVHSWRELLTEVGVVVIGVGIALAAEQAVEWVHWHNRVIEARGVIGNELVQVMIQGIERVRAENCIEQRLDSLAAVLDEATRKGALPPVPQTGQPPARPWPDDVWQTTMASDTATHFPQDQLNLMGRIYSQVRELRENNHDEQLAWSNLSAIIGPERRLDPASDAALRAALSQARYYSRIMALEGGQVSRTIGALNLPHAPEAEAYLKTVLQRDWRASALCKPLSAAAPVRSGQAQFSNDLIIFHDWQNYPPYIDHPPQAAK
jgi:hypothetical protein